MVKLFAEQEVLRMAECMRYRDLLKKVPEDVEIVVKGRGGNVIINVKKHLAKRGLAAIPSMF